MSKVVGLVNRLLDRIDDLEADIAYRDAHINKIEAELNKDKSLKGSREKEITRLNRELIKMQEELMEGNINE